MQVVDAGTYSKISREMGRSLQLNFPLRGRIMSSDGAVLADNQVYFNLAFTLDELHPRERYFSHLQKKMGLCEVPAHYPRYEICTCPQLEEHLFDVLGSPESVEFEILKSESYGNRLIRFVEDIPASTYRRFSNILLKNLSKIGIQFEYEKNSKTWTMFIRPKKILRMELTLLKLARICNIPYDLPDSTVVAAHTLRGKVAASIKEIKSHSGGKNEIENKKLLDRRNQLRVMKERVLVEGVSKEIITDVLYKEEKYAGIRVVRKHRRVYPSRESAGSITGYLKRVSRRQLDNWRQKDILLDRNSFGDPERFFSEFESNRRQGRFEEELLGAMGLEKTFDDRLRGLFGVQMILKDARSRPLPLPLHPQSPNFF